MTKKISALFLSKRSKYRVYIQCAPSVKFTYENYIFISPSIFQDSLSSTGRSMKCQQCPKTFYDMKSLQIHNFIEHHKQAPPPTTGPGGSGGSGPVVPLVTPPRMPLSSPFPTLKFNQASPPLPPVVSVVPANPNGSVVITRPAPTGPVILGASGPPSVAPRSVPSNVVITSQPIPRVLTTPANLVISGGPAGGPPPSVIIGGGPHMVSLPVLPPPPPASIGEAAAAASPTMAQIRPTSRPGSSGSSAASESEEKTYNCDLCGATGLPNRLAFKQHLLSHTRPFVCQRCDAGFMSQQQLEAHMAMHQNWGTLSLTHFRVIGIIIIQKTPIQHKPLCGHWPIQKAELQAMPFITFWLP